MPYVDGIFYELDKINKTATISKIAKNNRSIEVVIPPVVNGCKVTKVSDNAFADSKFLKTIVLPDAVTYIGKRAFKSCSNLEKVVIRTRRITLGECAFWGCEKIKEFVSDNWSTTIQVDGYGVFSNCRAIQFFNIDFIGKIHCETFNYCSSLTELKFAHGTELKTECIKNCPLLTRIYVDGELTASNPIRKKLKRLTLVCNELSSILDWAYEGYKIEYEDDFLPF